MLFFLEIFALILMTISWFLGTKMAIKFMKNNKEVQQYKGTLWLRLIFILVFTPVSCIIPIIVILNLLYYKFMVMLEKIRDFFKKLAQGIW